MTQTYVAVQALDVEDRDRFTMVYDDVWHALKGKSSYFAYAALKRRTNPDRKHWFGTQKALAAEAGVSVSTFRRGIEHLESLGLVVSRRRFAPRGWDGKDESKLVYGGRDDDHPQEIGKLYQIRFHMPVAGQGGVQNEQTPPPQNEQTPPPQNEQTPPPQNEQQKKIPLEVDTREIDTRAPKGEAPAKKEKQGHRIPEDWAPKPATLQRLQKRFPNADLQGSAEDFHAHWINKTTKDATKLDWDLAFGTWAKNDDGWGKNQRSSSSANSVEAWLGTSTTPSQPEINPVEENPFGPFIDHQEGF